MLHELLDGIREFVWQQVGEPDETTSCMTDGKDLERGVVMRQLPIDDRVCKPSPDVVDVDDPFTDHGPIGKGDEPGCALHTRVDDELACEPRVDAADIANRRPDLIDRRGYQQFFVDGAIALIPRADV